jgi:hypothetical protein
MHLPGKADTPDLLAVDAACRKDSLNRFLRRAPPVGRILLRPRSLRRGKWRVLTCRRSKNRSVLPYEDSS